MDVYNELLGDLFDCCSVAHHLLFSSASSTGLKPFLSYKISGMSVLCRSLPGHRLRHPLPGLCLLSADAKLCVQRAWQHHRCPVRQPDGIEPGRHLAGLQVGHRALGGEDD